MNDVVLRGNATVAAVAEQLGYLLPMGELSADVVVELTWLVRVAWIGPDGTNGAVFVGLDAGLADALTQNLTGRMPGDPLDEEEVAGTVCELANVVSGNLLPALYGTDHEFHLQQPTLVTPADDPGGRREAALQFLEGLMIVSRETDLDNTRILRRSTGGP